MTETLTLHFQDMSGQRRFVARRVPLDATFGDVRDSVVGRMALPPSTPDGENRWTGLLRREGRHLHGTEVVGDALVEGDRIELASEVIAG